MNKISGFKQLVMLLFVLLGVCSCSEEEVVDAYPPPTPRAANISISGPDDQDNLLITGLAGAVKEDVRVRASNTDAVGQGVVEVQANGSGAFSMVIAGDYLDRIAITAINDAGQSPTVTVVAGAPFSLNLGIPSGTGQEAPVMSVLADSVAFDVVDGDGFGVPGVTVEFSAAGGVATFSPLSVISDDTGRVAAQMTLGDVSGEMTVLGTSDEVTFATTAPLTVWARPAAADTLIWIAGGGQVDGPGMTLIRPLVIKAEDPFGNGVSGIEVLFDPVGGSVDPDRGTTNEAGTVETLWTLSGGMGEQQLTAVEDGGALTAENGIATAAAAPTITDIAPSSPLMPGNPLTIYGTDFCAVAEYNDVTLGGVAMVVVAASATQLIATVPAGLGDGAHSLAVTVGHQAATPDTYTVEVVSTLGDVLDYPFVNGSVTVDFVIPNASTKYAVIPYSIKHTGSQATTLNYGIEVATFGARSSGEIVRDPLAEFHERLLTPPAESPTSGSAVKRVRSAVGERAVETFHCLHNPTGYTDDIANYTDVIATRVYANSVTEIWVDNTVLPAAWAEESYIAGHLGDQFNNSDYNVVTDAFGEVTDIDGSGTVIILLSPLINSMANYLTESGGYVGGFFNLIDLDLFGIYEPSNSGEIFYALVPDPTGQYSQFHHTVTGTMDALRSILAHEFQHMVNAGQRHHEDYGNQPHTNTESLWLNEGLSHLAEDLCGYHDQNVARVGLYLHSGNTAQTVMVMDETVGLEPAVGNSLSQRGGAFLLCRYLEDRWPDITNRLSGSSYRGMANVANASGEDFDEVYKQWMAAIYLDDRDLNGDGSADDLGPEYRFSSHNLRTEYLYAPGDSDALAIYDLTFEVPALSSTLLPSSMDYITFRVAGGMPPAGNTKSITFNGPTTGEMGILVVRVAQ
ncbi:MAG: hypothetical protein GY835_17740 [bacterium]|nr:hypothetical protein [bacterium]